MKGESSRCFLSCHESSETPPWSLRTHVDATFREHAAKAKLSLPPTLPLTLAEGVKTGTCGATTIVSAWTSRSGVGGVFALRRLARLRRVQANIDVMSAFESLDELHPSLPPSFAPLASGY